MQKTIFIPEYRCQCRFRCCDDNVGVFKWSTISNIIRANDTLTLISVSFFIPTSMEKKKKIPPFSLTR